MNRAGAMVTGLLAGEITSHNVGGQVTALDDFLGNLVR